MDDLQIDPIDMAHVVRELEMIIPLVDKTQEHIINRLQDVLEFIEEMCSE